MSVLFVSNYPISKAIHGGQKRVAAINAYLVTEGVSTKVISIFQTDQYKYDWKKEIGFEINLGSQSGFLSDLEIGKMILTKVEILSSIKATIEKNSVKFIHLEQPYLFPLFHFLKKTYSDLQLIYSSHNIEFEMKRQIYQDIGIDQETIKVAVDEIRHLELSAAKEAKFCISVTENDASFLRQFSDSVYVLKNGIDNFSEKFMNPKLLKKYFPQISQSTYIFLFIGSAHVPNLSGFEEMIGWDLAFLPPGAQLIVVGGVSTMLEQATGYRRKQHINADRIKFVSNASESLLQTLIKRANCILLPIVSGGGSNLKTAEAIISLKPIIASDFAFRGYEKFRSYPHIRICENRDSFIDAMKEFALVSKAHVPDDRFKEKTNDVTWGEIMKAYPIHLLKEKITEN